MPQLQEKIDEVERLHLFLNSLVRQRTVEEIRPRILEESVQLVRLVPQERVQWIDKQLVEVCSLPRKSSRTQTHELKMQLDESFKKIDALWVQKSRILDQIEDHVEGGRRFRSVSSQQRTDWCSAGREEGLCRCPRTLVGTSERFGLRLGTF